jgi:hypothetical protein
LCGKYSNLGVTESYNIGETGDVRAENTICVRCIAEANRILFEGMLAAARTLGLSSSPND